MVIPDKFKPHLDAAMEMFEINTPRRKAAFLATVAHESGNFRYTRELWGKTPTKWQVKYQGRHGNVHKGDGYKYRGAGLIQCTFCDNFRDVTAWIREKRPDCPDFVLHPESMAEPEWASWSAAAWWFHHHLNTIADTGDIKRVRRVVNGPGMLGLAEVTKMYNSMVA